MERTESIAQLAKALVAAQAELRNAPLDKANSHFGQRYASLASITDTVRPILARHGIASVQLAGTPEPGKISVSTMLIHASGEYIRETMVIPIAGNIQQAGSAITYLRRYALAAIAGVVGDDDDDAEATVAPTRPAKASKASKPPAPPAASEGGSAAPAGFERVYPREVTEKTSKTGKTYWVCKLDHPAGDTLTANTFSSTVADRLRASIGNPTDVSLTQKEHNGSLYLSITEVI
jgi:hypothetical protein